ncbi:MAG: septum site-determining protein MinC [Anaerolineae bacterium]
MSVRDAPHEMPTPPKPPIAVKGRGDGLRIQVTGSASPEELAESLRQQLERRSNAFFSGASVTLELPVRPLDMALAATLADVVSDASMELTAVVSTASAAAEDPAGAGTGAASSAGTSAGTGAGTGSGTATRAGTGSRAGADKDRGRPAAVRPPGAPGGALVVTGTLRSGQRVAHDGSVIILGDVNPGAEVIAGESVVVWGRLRGIVEAGVAEGGDSAVVCALDLAPTQLRIGPALARAPEEPDRQPEPEVARQEDGRIVVDAWS